MKYKVGDRVRVRKDLKPGNFYGKDYYISSMDKFKGEKCVITEIWDQSYQINNFGYWWSEEMFESVDDEKVLEYALEKLGMTKEELENEMDKDEEDLEKAKEIVRLTYETDAYCDSFNGKCQECKVQDFRDKYYKFGQMSCYGVFKYLKEKGEI